ncbi:DUF6456 domain-containing protein [Rhizobium halophytocola]|uniref:DUF6456 domain-containing protein n=1 Tax=Rhizobium halophytocola TaxID=735519 RepID=A0ABS4E5U7_9HYPH|nr:DUF6456 domain-containing protein [Rhizobium halophytocola]MBP1853292.1 hypothetical protein [Rhizobium halophytocola]
MNDGKRQAAEVTAEATAEVRGEAKAGRNAGMAALGRLLRFVLAGAPCRVTPVGGGFADIAAADGSLRRVPANLVTDGLRRGLLIAGDGAIRPAPEARAFLRRLAADTVEDACATQHRQIERSVLPAGSGELSGPVSRNLKESPLGPLSRLKDRSGVAYFPKPALAAADRLASDFDRAGLQPRITQSWAPRLAEASGRRGVPDNAISDSAAAARRRLDRAMEAMGPDLAGVALDVCCFGKGLELVERERQWPVRAAKLMLRTALLSLARHYQPPKPKPRSRHWGADDFRPQL